MARFYGLVRGRARTVATRLGNEKLGLSVRAQGWNVGVFVDCRVDKQTGKDIIYVYKTGGTNNPKLGDIIAIIEEE